MDSKEEKTDDPNSEAKMLGCPRPTKRPPEVFTCGDSVIGLPPFMLGATGWKLEAPLTAGKPVQVRGK